MSIVTKGISMFILSLLILSLLIMVVLGFMLGFGHPLPWILIAILVLIPVIHDKIIARRFVKWKNSYSVGVESIDNDHKKLLCMLNQLQTASHYTTYDGVAEGILNDLVEYTEYHFFREEELMKECNYPGFDAHRKQHEAMISQVSTFIEEYRVDGT
ncbi:hypothetical protein MNBD_GAMMA11-2488, partial [hydrothermal vent metagenome]